MHKNLDIQIGKFSRLATAKQYMFKISATPQSSHQTSFSVVPIDERQGYKTRPRETRRSERTRV